MRLRAAEEMRTISSLEDGPGGGESLQRLMRVMLTQYKDVLEVCACAYAWARVRVRVRVHVHERACACLHVCVCVAGYVQACLYASLCTCAWGMRAWRLGLAHVCGANVCVPLPPPLLLPSWVLFTSLVGRRMSVASPLLTVSSCASVYSLAAPQTIRTHEQAKTSQLASSPQMRDAFLAFAGSERRLAEQDSQAWTTILDAEKRLAAIEQALVAGEGVLTVPFL